MEGNLPFFFCLTLYLRAFSKYEPPGAYIRRGDFCNTSLGDLLLEGLRPVSNVVLLPC